MNLHEDPDDTPPNAKGHLVCTGKNSDGDSVITIHVSGNIIKNYFCNVFYAKNSTRALHSLPEQYSTQYHDLVSCGWFQDLAVFDQICAGVPVVNAADWPIAVLATIRAHHQASWADH
jgi:hypothetical protein